MTKNLNLLHKNDQKFKFTAQKCSKKSNLLHKNDQKYKFTA